MIVRNLARYAIYEVLYALISLGRGVRVILLYHSVGSRPHSFPLGIFQRQMKMLTQHFNVVRLCELPERMASAPSGANIACVTFDDGYLDSYEIVLPVLEQARIKGTFFISTSFLGKTFPASAGEFPTMTPAQVRELAALGHEIGAHTVNHPKLTRVPRETARKEILNSKDFLEDLTGSEVMSFAYPKGDYDEEVKTLVGSLGFKLAVTVRPELVNDHPDWLALPRLGVSGKLLLRKAVTTMMSRHLQHIGMLGPLRK